MNILKRIFKFGQAEVHAAIDQIESPIKMTEQGIRDMKKDLGETLKAFAEVQAIAKRNQADLAECEAKASEYESKAIRLLTAVEKRELSAEEGDRLAKKSLGIKKQQEDRASYLTKEKEKLDNSLTQLRESVEMLKQNIGTWENELRTLKARDKVSKASLRVNKQLSQVDSSGTVALLDRMKDKVNEQEALSESYAEVNNQRNSADDEIDSALYSKEVELDNSLEELKKKLSA